MFYNVSFSMKSRPRVRKLSFHFLVLHFSHQSKVVHVIRSTQGQLYPVLHHLLPGVTRGSLMNVEAMFSTDSSGPTSVQILMGMIIHLCRKLYVRVLSLDKHAERFINLKHAETDLMLKTISLIK